MLKDCIEIFAMELEKTKEQFGNREKFILDSYIPADGDYIVVQKDGTLKSRSFKLDKKTRTLNGMHMDIAAAVVTVHVGADQRLMPRKVGFYIFHADGLRLFTCQSTLVFVGRIEADEVVVRLDFVVILILVVLRIKHFALHIKKFRFTVYALQKNISTEYPVPVCIQQGPLQNFVMLIFQIVECSTIVCTFTRDVF